MLRDRLRRRLGGDREISRRIAPATPIKRMGEQSRATDNALQALTSQSDVSESKLWYA
jgi:hypothetical protein